MVNQHKNFQLYNKVALPLSFTTVYIPRLLHAMNEEDTDRRLEYCVWSESMMRDDEAFAGKVVWSDEA